MAFLNLRYHQAVGIPTARDISAVNTTIKTLEQVLGSREIIDGRLLENVTINSTATQLQHGLGRVPKGFIVVDYTVFPDSGIYRTAWDEKTITLVADTTSIYSLWVF